MFSQLVTRKELSLKNLKDAELLSFTKALAQREREVTTQILRHLQEIERRKLYCDLKYGSIFDYAVKELGYSEAAAHRRIQAMRLMTEIPEVEQKIESGSLNLSNVCQAQSFFREQKKAQPEAALSKDDKKIILEKLEQKSAREGQRVLLELGGEHALPRERERIVGAEHTEMRFVMSQELRTKLEEVRSLLGARGAQMNFAELVAEMANLSSERLAEMKFGKKRVQQQINAAAPGAAHSASPGPTVSATPGPSDSAALGATHSDVESEMQSPRMTRYISRATKHEVWQKARGACEGCGARQNLQYDHIQPFALGGDSSPENLQLLCRACNLRHGVKDFGAEAMRRARG